MCGRVCVAAGIDFGRGRVPRCGMLGVTLVRKDVVLSAYVTPIRDHASVQDAVESSFAPEYEVLQVAGTDRDDIFLAVATRDGKDPKVYEYRVEQHGGEYHFWSCIVDAADYLPAFEDGVLETLLTKYDWVD